MVALACAMNIVAQVRVRIGLVGDSTVAEGGGWGRASRLHSKAPRWK
jgi:hypothetical protein